MADAIDFTKLKVGYWPNRQHLDHPGDRRRFVFFAREKNILFDIADPAKQYDIIYLTSACNVSQWIAYKKKNPSVKLIFELTDSYLLQPWSLSSTLRSTTRYLFDKEKEWYADYRSAFKEIAGVADAVVCSTPLQRDDLLSYNSNVHISLDYFSDDITAYKNDFSREPKLKLVWEGQAYTVKNLLLINNVWAQLKDKIELHVITDPIIQYPLKMFNRSTESVLKRLACQWYFHKWEKNTFSELIAGADAAVIPIDTNDKLMVNKPENKLLLLWEIGIPVFTSCTPAYKRVMDEAGIFNYCNDQSSWLKALQNCIQSTQDDMQGQIKKAQLYLQSFHSKQKLIDNWEKIFASVIQ